MQDILHSESLTGKILWLILFIISAGWTYWMYDPYIEGQPSITSEPRSRVKKILDNISMLVSLAVAWIGYIFFFPWTLFNSNAYFLRAMGGLFFFFPSMLYLIYPLGIGYKLFMRLFFPKKDIDEFNEHGEEILLFLVSFIFFIIIHIIDIIMLATS